MERNTKRIICICLCTLIVALNIRVARAEAVPDVLYGSATVADCVMSYYAMSGAAVANTDWINTLYNDLGSSFGTIYDFAQNGMLTLNSDGTWQATTALETAIENAPAYQSLGLDQVFNVTSAEVAAGGGLAAASGGSILGGALGCTASVGVLPVLGGVTAAYWGGIAIGTLVNHLIDKYARAIFTGVPITAEEVLNSLPANTNPVYSKIKSSSYGNYKYLWYVEGASMYWADLKYNNSFALIYYNATSQALKYYRESPEGYITSGTSSNGIPLTNGVGSITYDYDVRPEAQPISYTFNSQQDYQDFIAGLRNGTIVPKKSSNDMIGEDGNLQGEKNNEGNITVPDMKPQIDPGVQSGVPLSLSDWLNFANSAKNNNSQSNPLPDNSTLFKNIVDLIKKSVPNPNPNPNPNPDPYTPPVPTPSPDPDYDPNPDNPNQPDYESEREGQTEPVPDSVPTGAPWITDGLLDKFPFCIPKDMIDMVKNFSSGTRQAPYISWRFNPPNTPVDYTFNLDLSDFEEIATLLRLLELGAFIVGLAFATRYLIGAT